MSADLILRDYCEARLKGTVKPPDAQEKLLHEVILRSLSKLGADRNYAELEQCGLVEAQIGPNRGTDTAYLRPEGVQSAVISFKRLFEYNQKQLPFAVAQSGTMFHNYVPFPQCEGFMNTREFCVFEQNGGQEAVRRPLKDYLGVVIKNQTVLFYMARWATFLKITGVKVDRLRHRQLWNTEMPHYAQDAEISTSYGCMKIGSIADCGTYDAEQHSRGSGQSIVANVDQASAESVAPAIVQLSLVVPRLMYAIVEHAFRDEGHRLELQNSVAP